MSIYMHPEGPRVEAFYQPLVSRVDTMMMCRVSRQGKIFIIGKFLIAYCKPLCTCMHACGLPKCAHESLHCASVVARASLVVGLLLLWVMELPWH